MSALEVFDFEGVEVRTVVIDGEPWFVGNDVARVLSYVNPAAAIAAHAKGVAKRYPLQTAGGVQEVRVLSEPDMLRLIVASRLPQSERFERWVFEEVLPSIRRTGAYAAPETRESLLARAVLEANAVISEAHQQIEALTPKAEAWDEIADAGTDYAIRDAAPMLSRAGIETGPQRLFESLRELGWIYRGEKGRWTPYARVVDAGYLTVRAMPPYRDRDTGDLKPSAPQVRITPHGLERLRIRLGSGVLTP